MLGATQRTQKTTQNSRTPKHVVLRALNVIQHIEFQMNRTNRDEENVNKPTRTFASYSVFETQIRNRPTRQYIRSGELLQTRLPKYETNKANIQNTKTETLNPTPYKPKILKRKNGP